MLNTIRLYLSPLSSNISSCGSKTCLKTHLIQRSGLESNGHIPITLRIPPQFTLPSTEGLETFCYVVQGDLILDYPHVIEDRKPSRRGDDELILIPSSINHLSKMPEWGNNHSLSNVIPGFDKYAYNNYAFSVTGRVGDVHNQFTPESDYVCEERNLALTRNRERVTQTPLWVKAAFWNKKAAYAKSIQVSDIVEVQGPITMKNWVDRFGFNRIEVNLNVNCFYMEK